MGFSILSQRASGFECLVGRAGGEIMSKLPRLVIWNNIGMARRVFVVVVGVIWLDACINFIGGGVSPGCFIVAVR